MAKLYRSDLEMVNNYARTALHDEVKDSAALIANITSFVNGSTTLTGAAWDKERIRLSAYLPILEKRKTLSTAVILAIKDANKVMEGYLDGFPFDVLATIPDVNIPKATINYVDDSWLGELNAALSKAQTTYNTSWAKSSDSDIVKQSKKNTRDKQDAIIKACKAVIQYLEQLQPKAKEAYAKYESVLTEIAALKTMNHDINESLFDHIDGRTHVKTVYVGGGGYVNNGGGTTTNVTPTPVATPPNVTPTEPTNTNPTTVDNPTTTEPVVTTTPITRTNTTTGRTQTRTTTTTTTPNKPVTTKPDVEVVEQPTKRSNIEVVEPTEKPTTATEEVVTPNIQTQTVKTVKKDSAAKKVALGVLGAAALGGAAYGTYTAAKHIKENNQINDDDDEETFDYSDTNNVDIKTGKDDI